MKTEVIPFVAMVVIAPAELGGRMELVKSGPRRLERALQGSVAKREWEWGNL